MDLLANYSDDGDSAKNTPTTDRSDQVMPKLDAVKSDASLEAEWESFEKMISGLEEPKSVAHPLTVAYPILTQKKEFSDPPVLTSMKDSDHVDMFEVEESKPLSNVAAIRQPPKLTDIALAPEYNTDSLYGEMPILTRISASSPEHSSSESSSSGSGSRSRSQSVESDKGVSKPEKKEEKASTEKELPVAFRKDSSPSRQKDEKRNKGRSRSRSPHRRRRRSSDRKRSHSRSPGRRRSEKRRRSRSRDKKRKRSSSRSRHRRRSRSRSRRRTSRERHSSRDRHRRRGSREHRKNRDRKDKRRRSRSHSRDRHRSNSRDRHRSRSRSRSRSRERARKFGGSKDKPMTFKEKMRQQLIKASRILSDKDSAGPSDFDVNAEKPSSIPLSAANIFSAISSSGSVTPQMALLQTMAAMHQKAQEITGVAVPKFYNPAAVNPLKYAEQVQKRKLLWSKNKEKKEDEGQWQSTAFVQDQDGKVAAKFRKLMGMKEGAEKPEESDEEKARETEEKKKQTEELFYRLDKEYEFARMTTHTQRGVGLGFHSQGFPNT